MKALAAKGTPGGFALGHATGDANTWCHWVVWAFGGKMVDKSGKVVIDSPETIKALEYSKELYGTSRPARCLGSTRATTRRFLDGQISVTNNGISIYYAAKTSKDPKINAAGADINHSVYPAGPGGSNAAFHLFLKPDDLSSTPSTRRRRRSSCAS